MIDAAIQDLRFTARQLFRRPGYAVLVTLTLALGVGAVTAMASVAYGVLLRPPPYPQPERLVRIWDRHDERAGWERVDVNPANFRDWQTEAALMAGFGGFTTPLLAVRWGERAELVRGARVTAGFFDLLGVAPALGRELDVSEDRPGGPPVAILSWSAWQGALAGDPAVLGRVIEVDETPHVVVGVMPQDFRFPFMPENDPPRLYVPGRVGAHNGRGGHWLKAIARLAPGVELARAQTELSAIARRLEDAHPETNAGLGVVLEPLREALAGGSRPLLALFGGAVALLLLIACVNVAGLLLIRTAGRQDELALRRALGAGRGRLARQLVTESLALAIFGGGLGVALAWAAVRAVRFLGDPLVPRAGELVLDGALVFFAFAVAAVTALAAALVPICLAGPESRNDADLAGAGRGGASRRVSRLGGLLVMAQVAVATLLLAGAGLLLQSLARLGEVDPGFATEGRVALRVALPGNRYPPAARDAFIHELLARAREIPGVRAAGAGDAPPFQREQRSRSSFVPLDRPPAAGEEPMAWEQYVTPGYLDALGLRLISGRDVDSRDVRQGAPGTILINEVLARRIWPGEDAIGKRIDFNGEREVIGVVAASRRDALDVAPEMELFLPYAQWPHARALFVVLRTETPLGSPLETLVPAFRELLNELDPGVALGTVATLAGLVDDTLAAPRLRSFLLGTFAGLALILAALGIYGVLAYSVRRRRHELGVRLALGARAGELLQMVVRSGLALVLVGVAIGLLGALGLGRLLEAFLFAVEPADPATLVAVVLILTAVALVASYLPARRAARVDPVESLRAE